MSESPAEIKYLTGNQALRKLIQIKPLLDIAGLDSILTKTLVQVLYRQIAVRLRSSHSIGLLKPSGHEHQRVLVFIGS